MNAGELINRIRYVAGFSQSQMATVLGVKQPSVARYETGVARVPQYVIDKLHVFSQEMSKVLPHRRQEIKIAWNQYFDASPSEELDTDNLVVSGILVGLGLLLVNHWLKNED